MMLISISILITGFFVVYSSPSPHLRVTFCSLWVDFNVLFQMEFKVSTSLIFTLDFFIQTFNVSQKSFFQLFQSSQPLVCSLTELCIYFSQLVKSGKIHTQVYCLLVVITQFRLYSAEKIHEMKDSFFDINDFSMMPSTDVLTSPQEVAQMSQTTSLICGHASCNQPASSCLVDSEMS